MGNPTIAIVGSGRVGLVVGGRLLQAGWDVTFGARDIELARERIESRLPGAKVARQADAIAEHPFILLAVPWNAMESTIRANGVWAGKVLIDCSNPLNAKFNGLEFGFSTSAAEKIQEWALDASVVKALNTAGTELMRDPTVNGELAAAFYCGDCKPAKEMVRSMLQAMGFDPVDVGPLHQARYLESLAMMCIDMAIRHGFGNKVAFKLLREPV